LIILILNWEQVEIRGISVTIELRILEHVDVHERIILKLMFRIGCILIRTGANYDLLWALHWNSGFWIPERHLASQEVN
jgi:hypothetical protein